MAINPIPRSSFELQFGVLGAMDLNRGLLPAFIAPRYAVHTTDGEAETIENGFIGTYGETIKENSGEVPTIAWPNRSETDSAVDVLKPTVTAPAPVVLVNSKALQGTVDTNNKNILKFNSSILASGNGYYSDASLHGYNLVPGDKLHLKKKSETNGKDTVVTVVDVQAETEPPSIGKAKKVANSGDEASKCSMLRTFGEFTGTEECVYLVRVAKTVDIAQEFSSTAATSELEGLREVAQVPDGIDAAPPAIEKTGSKGSKKVNTVNSVSTTSFKAARIEFEVTSLKGEVGYRKNFQVSSYLNAAQEIGNYGVQLELCKCKDANKCKECENCEECKDNCIKDKGISPDPDQWPVGLSFVITCTPARPGKKNIVYVDAELEDNGNQYDVIVESANVVGTSVDLQPAFYRATEAGLKFQSGATINFGGTIYKLADSTKLFVSYRELLKTDTFRLLDVRTTGTAEWAGAVDPGNPLGMMYGIGSSIAGTQFYLMAVPDSSDESYIKAIDYISQFEEVFAPVCYDQTPAIQTALVAMVKKYSDPYVAQYKKAWLSALTTQRSEVYVKDAQGHPLLGSLNEGVLTLEEPANAVSAGIKLGDIVVLKNMYVEDLGAYMDREYTVSAINDKSSLQLSGAGSIKNYVNAVEFYREMNNSEYAAALAREAKSFNSAWVNLVWSDSLTVLGFPDQPLSLLCCALSALRASLPPHAPLSDVTVPTVQITDNLKFSDPEYDVMNSGGVWIVRLDSTGSPVTAHQITTLTDGTIAEEDSVVANGVSIARELRNATRKYRGNANVSQDLIDQLRVDLTSVFVMIAGRTYAPIYGPQLESYSIVSIKRDEANKQRLLIKLAGDMPLPLIDSQSVFALN